MLNAVRWLMSLFGVHLGATTTVQSAVTSKENQPRGKMLIQVKRTKKTFDGILGVMTLQGNPFICYTIENLEKSIPAGTYDVVWAWSPKFNRETPHIIVPNRTFIEIHTANYPYQLEGCIAVGDHLEDDAVDNSKVTDKRLEDILHTWDSMKIEKEGRRKTHSTTLTPTMSRAMVAT